MDTENEAPSSELLTKQIAPLSVTLALLALVTLVSLIEGREVNGEFLVDAILISMSVMIPGCIGRAVSRIPMQSSTSRVAILSSGLLVISIIANFADPSVFDHMFMSTFVVVGIISASLDEARRFEESSIFLSTILGLRLAVFYAASLGIAENTSSALVDVQRASLGAAFFTFWLTSISLGIVVLFVSRGMADERGVGSMFSGIPYVRENRDVLTYSSLAFIGFLIPLIWLGQLESLGKFSEGSHLGLVWAIFSALVVFLHAFFRSEGWHVLGSLLAVNWFLYTLGHLHEIGNELPSLFSEDGFIGSFTWFFLGFWLNFFAIFFASRGVFGDISPRREKSGFRIWWESNSYSILVFFAFIVALVVRTAWNVIPAMNANGTGLWDMTGGSDPWYMKRVVDYVILERSHLIFDHDRAYPIGGINPRPPLFSWSLALGALALSWVIEIAPNQAVWWSMSSLPAIYGALIVLPIAGIASRAHSRRAGIFAAWLIALMPGHMSRSTFAMSDHDSFAMLFLAIAFYFWMRALEEIEHKKVFQTTSTNPLYIIAGMRETWKNNPALMANATMSGIAFSIMALGWKGFVYGPGILFLAYSFQVAINIFRGRDSLQSTSAALQMMLTSIIIPAPFYAWPGMNLIFDPTGMQPMFYIIGFTFAVGWVSSSFRDKPWLLVVMGGSALFGSILAALFMLQKAQIYNGWDILFTGGFYFSKNKIFGTIGEAQAPDRGVLFASFGPLVSLIAIGCSFVLLWRGSRKNKSGLTLLGLWTIIATYMAWTAGRFIINATPAMAVVGGIGITMLWSSANFSGFSKVWRNSGIGTPRTRFRSIWPATKARPGVPAMLIVILLMSSQHATYGIDSGIPRGQQSAYEVDQGIYDFAPDILRHEFFDLFSILNSRAYDPIDSGMWYMGTFGPSFNSQGWNDAYEWLSHQDDETPFSQRPAFVSWWDYGFQALSSGQHPTVADNFQSGIPNSGAMLLSAGQEDTLSLFIATLATGDRRINDGQFSEEFSSVLETHFSTPQIDEFEAIFGNGNVEFVKDRSMAVVASYGSSELLKGKILDENGLPLADDFWVVVKDGENFGDQMLNESEALALFDEARGSSSPFEIVDSDEASHFDIGGYRYTRDLIDDYDDISTGLHRTNAKFGLIRAFLTSAFELSELVDIYDGISSMVNYEVSNYDEAHGITTTRNHEIRYFAVDNRLYPLGGSYYGDYQTYHRGQTTGIFHAPTHLSGLDIDTYIKTTYETNQGSMTSQEYQDRYLEDIRAQASGSSTAEDMITMTDIDYQHRADFFETMVARTYVGYGSSSLGLQSVAGQIGDADSPSTWIAPGAISGTPGGYLQGAMSLPGAMMNHFVLANWYDPSDGSHCEQNETGQNIEKYCGTVYDSNRFVKILKYYSGANLEGTVTLDGIGPVPNARILIERDAFSGEEDSNEEGHVVDNDSRTYWIPIGTTQADQEGRFSFTVPSGKIRVSAFSGEPDLEMGRSVIMSGGLTMYELFCNGDEQWNSMYGCLPREGPRQVNPVTGILGNVYGSTWLSETIVNVSGADGHSNGESTISAPIIVSPSSASGILSWSGESEFDGSPVLDVDVILTPSSEEISVQPYLTQTSNGSMTGESLFFSGSGEVTFYGQGSVESQGSVTVKEFTGTHSQEIYDNHSITGEGKFSGRGSIAGSISGDFPSCVNESVPIGSEACSAGDGFFLINGTINGSGKFTSQGTSEYTRELFQATFIGSGVFVTNTSHNLESLGTINGSGTFSGDGIFSGQMVSPGSFHIIDALPGDYTLSVDFGDGNIVELPEVFSIPLEASEEKTEISISGGAIKGTVSLHSGEPLYSNVAIFPVDGSSEDATVDCLAVVIPPCLASPDEDGSFQLGPIPPGSYIAEVDTDEDGFPEISQIYTFEPNQGTLEAFPSKVPLTYDISFSLTDGGEIVEDLDLQLRPENMSLQEVNAVYDNTTKIYYAELFPGDWILNYTLNDEKQVWQRVTISDQDISESFQFLVSQVVQGSVVDASEKSESSLNQIRSPVPFQEVTFQWDGFSLSATTDSSGNFEVTLPQGVFVDATVERVVGAGGFLSNGTRFQVTEEMGNITINLVDSTTILGSVSLNREGNSYNQGFLGWEPVHAIANNLDGTTDSVWREEVDEMGRFEMLLPLGNWSFTLDAGDTRVSSVTRELNSTNDPSVELLLLPVENSTVLIDFYIDHQGDNNLSNGTLVSYPFQIKPLTQNGRGLAVSSDEGDEWLSTGRAKISLEPGKYRIVVERANRSADDPFDTLYDLNKIFDVGLDSSTIERSVGFEPLWLTNITFRNESGELLVNQEVSMVNTENGWIRTFNTDNEGRIVDYVREGNWIVVVDEFETFSDVYEGLRRIITISQETAADRVNFQTSQLSTVSINLQSNFDVSDLEVLELHFTSQNGLGSFISTYSGFAEPLIVRTTPGYWNVEVNQTNSDGVRLLVDNTTLVESGLSPGSNHQLTLQVQRLVQLGGKVFWDLDDDGSPSFSEGLANASVSISGWGEQVTGLTGEWSVYLPVQSELDITVEKSGFSTEQVSISLGDSSLNRDIEISAGEVSVSGTLTYLDESCISSDEWEVVLVPSHGISRDIVTATKSSAQFGSAGNWSASIEPGNWIVYSSTSSDSSECNGLVSVDLLEVGVEGATSVSDLTVGGIINLDTRWIDFNGVENDLSDAPDYDLKVEFDGISWSEDLDEEGKLSILLPPGSVQVSGEFELDEGGRNVSYSGGKGMTVRAGQESPTTILSIERVSKQDISAIVSTNSTVEVTKEDPDCQSECLFENAEFTIQIDYEGHNSFDSYQAVATVPGTDGIHWSVEFQNSTGSWNNSLSFDLGLENEVSKEIKIRVSPANSSVAHHFQNGHLVVVKFSTIQGYSTQVELTVQVPVTRNLEINEPETLYFNPDFTSVTLAIPFQNLGNSDEMFSFDFQNTEWWEISGPMTQPSSAFSEGLATFTFFRIVGRELPIDYAETIQFSVSDQTGNSYSGQTNLVMEYPSLSIIGDVELMGGGGDFAKFGEVETYSVRISNAGNIDVDQVTLLATLCEDIKCEEAAGVNSSSTTSVPAMGESQFFIDMDYTQFDERKNFFILFEILGEESEGIAQPCGSENAEGDAKCVEEAELWVASEENDNLKYLAYVFAAMLLLALLYFTRRPGRRVSAPF